MVTKWVGRITGACTFSKQFFILKAKDRENLSFCCGNLRHFFSELHRNRDKNRNEIVVLQISSLFSSVLEINHRGDMSDRNDDDRGSGDDLFWKLVIVWNRFDDLRLD